MQFGVSLLALFLLSGCSAMLMGSGSTGHGNREASVTASDSAITNTVSGQLRTDTTVNVFDIDVTTYKGTVTLTGTVSDYAVRDRAAYIAKGTRGVVAVNNLIRIER